MRTAASVAAVCLGALASMWAYQSTSDAQSVLAVRQTIERGDVITADFRVQNVLLHDEADATFRFGCAWLNLRPQVEQRVHDWTQGARRRKQLLSLSLDL